MPALLVIDTALEACSVAVAGLAGRDDVILSETIGRGHAERLFGMLEAALRQAEIGIAEVGRFAVTVGPGSFTGVRVGVAAVRGLMLATGRPGISLSTLAAHAETARAIAGARPVLAALDARGGGVYAQLFDAGGRALSEAAAGAPGDFAAGDAMLAGSGAPSIAHAARLPAERIVHRLSAPDPAALVALALRAAPGSAPPRPLYLRPPDAKPALNFAVARR